MGITETNYILTSKFISFENIDLGGGFQSIVNGVIGNQRRCYIKGFLCFATEARFGGIIISSYENKNDRKTNF